MTAIAHHVPQPELSAAVRLVIGDADIALLDQAIAGQDCHWIAKAVCRHHTPRPMWFMLCSQRVDSHEVRRIAAISSLSVGTSIIHVNWFFRAVIPLFFRGVMPDKEGMEAAFRASGHAWLVVRPSGLTDRPRTGNVRVLALSSFEKGFQIARADVAAYILNAPESDDPLRRIEDITTT